MIPPPHTLLVWDVRLFSYSPPDVNVNMSNVGTGCLQSKTAPVRSWLIATIGLSRAPVCRSPLFQLV